jgi:hypothetical protein
MLNSGESSIADCLTPFKTGSAKRCQVFSTPSKNMPFLVDNVWGKIMMGLEAGRPLFVKPIHFGLFFTINAFALEVHR